MLISPSVAGGQPGAPGGAAYDALGWGTLEYQTPRHYKSRGSAGVGIQTPGVLIANMPEGRQAGHTPAPPTWHRTT